MTFPRSARVAIRASACCGLAALGGLVAAAGPAIAQDTPNGQNGSTAPISTVAIILIFVGAPLTIMIIGAMLTIPSRAVGALRYRPGRSWGFQREWFGLVPPGAGGAATAAQGRLTPGQGSGANTGPAEPAGASATVAQGSRSVATIAQDSGAPVHQPGGASADW